MKVFTKFNSTVCIAVVLYSIVFDNRIQNTTNVTIEY